jgi:hypothetical protein
MDKLILNLSKDSKLTLIALVVATFVVALFVVA